MTNYHQQQQKNSSHFNFNPTEIDVEQVKNVNLKEIRPITEQDFVNSLKRIRRSVASQSIIAYEKWAKDYGDVTY